jgi:MurNAc alpha-1-phosphate uridylyltransferase
VTIHYSREGERAEDALETLGGIVRALPHLGAAPFIVVSGDIVTDFDYSKLAAPAAAIADGRVDAHLILVDNPPFHVQGDMGLGDGRVAPDLPQKLTYANIGVFAPRLFAGLAPTRARLFPWLYGAARAGRVSGDHFRGRWYNIGTPEELRRVDRELLAHPLHAEPSKVRPRRNV